MSVDTTVNIGQLLTAISFLAALIGGWYGIKSQLEMLGAKVTELSADNVDIKRELRTQTDILVRMGQYDIRLQALNERVNELSNRHARAN